MNATPKSFKSWLKSARIFIALVILFGVLTFLTDGVFLTPRNLTNLSRQVAINGILAVGMTYVILLGGIDLSVGSVVALAGVAAGISQVHWGLGVWTPETVAWQTPFLGAVLSVLLAVLVGTLCGIFNGWMITRQRIAPFIITLGMMVIARGLALILSDGAAVAPMGDSFNEVGQGYLSNAASLGLIGLAVLVWIVSWFKRASRTVLDYFSLLSVLCFAAATGWVVEGYRGIPYPVLLFAFLALFGTLVLNRTRLGRFVLAIGGNPDAAWLSGVPIRKITFATYVVLGTLAGLSGAVLSARLNGALPTAGELFELDAIAAVVIGGTSLLGGVGSVTGSVFGAFFIGALNNGMSLLDVNEFYQKVIKGVIIILAVWFDNRDRR